MKKVFKFSGIAAIPVYIVFTLISHLQSRSMGPFGNWLSDYGSPYKNPSGALYYNIGCILAAVLLALFYIGMTRWHKGAERKYVICYIGAEAGGLVAACSLILASLIPIGTSDLHKTFSMINMIGMDFFIVFIAIAAFIDPFVSSFLGVFGIITAAFNILTTNFLTNFYIGEWVYFALFMVYVAAVTYNYDRFDGRNMKAAHAIRSGEAR